MFGGVLQTPRPFVSPALRDGEGPRHHLRRHAHRDLDLSERRLHLDHFVVGHADPLGVFHAQVGVVRLFADELRDVRGGRVHAPQLSDPDQLHPIRVLLLLFEERLHARVEGLDVGRRSQVDLPVFREDAFGPEEVLTLVLGKEQPVRVLLGHLLAARQTPALQHAVDQQLGPREPLAERRVRGAGGGLRERAHRAIAEQGHAHLVRQPRVHPPLVPHAGRRLEDRVRVDHVRRGAATSEALQRVGHLRPLHPGRCREHVVREVSDLVPEEVDRDQQFEGLEGLVEAAVGIATREQRIARLDDEGGQPIRPVVQDVVREHPRRLLPAHGRERVAPVVARHHLGVVGDLLGHVDEALPHQGSSATIEIARDRVDALEQPEAERAAAALIDAGRHVERSALCLTVAAHEVAEGLCRHPRDLRLPIRRPGLHGLLETGEVLHVSFDAVARDPTRADHLVRERRQKVDVRVRANEEVLPRDRRLDPARVHEHDSPTALHDRLEALDGAREVIERVARDGRVRTEDHHEFGVLDVRMREAHRRAIHVLVHPELVHRVAGARAIHAARAEAGIERTAEHRCEHVRTARGADEVAEGLRPVLGDQRTRLLRDLPDRLVPRDVLPLGPHALDRIQQSIRAVLRPCVTGALHAGVSLRHDVVRIGFDVDDPVRLDVHVDLQSAGRLADATEGGLALDGHRPDSPFAETREPGRV